MYPLPPELEQKVWQAIGQGIDTDGDPAQDIFNAFATLVVRENRRMRQQICQLWRDFRETSDRDDLEYGSVMSAAGGEFTCEHIIKKVIKPNVYFNTDEQAEKEAAVDQLIEDFFADDDTVSD